MKDDYSFEFPFFTLFLVATITVLTYFYVYWVSFYQQQNEAPRIEGHFFESKPQTEFFKKIV